MGSCDQVSFREAMESFKVSVCVLAVVGLCQSAPQVNTNQVVQTVTTQLQPLISDAVARALASISISSSSSSSGFARASSSGSFGATSGAAVARGLSEEEELEYNRKLNANAAYDYGYKAANDEKQTYMAHEETRQRTLLDHGMVLLPEKLKLKSYLPLELQHLDQPPDQLPLPLTNLLSSEPSCPSSSPRSALLSRL